MVTIKVKFYLDSENATMQRTFAFNSESEKEAFIDGMAEITNNQYNKYEIIPEEVKITTITAQSWEDLELTYGDIILQIPNKDEDGKVLPKLISLDEATLEERGLGTPYVQVNGAWTKANVIRRT